MIQSVIKFGGSSLAKPSNIIHAASIINNPPPNVLRQHVVVSAPGKRFPNDIKCTDLLISAHTAASNKDKALYDTIIHKIVSRFQELSLSLPFNTEIWDRAQNSNQKHSALSYALSRGEFFNAAVVAAALENYEIIDPADSFIIFDPHTQELDMTSTMQAIGMTFGQEITNGSGYIIPGFYGSISGNPLNIQTFSRGGSDITASLVAAALHDVSPSSTIVHENFTDVDGIYNADPNICRASIISELGYQQCKRMALAGANVLHSDAIRPLEERAIPLWIRNVRPLGKNVEGKEIYTKVTATEVCSGNSDTSSSSIVLAVCGQEDCITIVCKNKVNEDLKLNLINELQEFLEQNDVNALVMKCTDDVSIEIKVDENKRNDILSLLHGYIYR